MTAAVAERELIRETATQRPCPICGNALPAGLTYCSACCLVWAQLVELRDLATIEAEKAAREGNDLLAVWHRGRVDAFKGALSIVQVLREVKDA